MTDIFIPRLPGEGGPHLVALLAADKRRRAVFENIVARLETDGSFGDCARYYISRHSFRRATLRSILSATNQAFPEWSRESASAEKKNAAFVAAYRDTYNAFRRDKRQETKAAAPA